MLTYKLEKGKIPLYEQLYMRIKKDIVDDYLKSDEKLPSKRAISNHLNISVITVENAYNQLLSEGYIYSRQRRGYFVSNLIKKNYHRNFSDDYLVNEEIVDKTIENNILYDLSSNNVSKDSFPFSVWAKLMREVLSEKSVVYEKSHYGGIRDLKYAISKHLHGFHNLKVNPDNIIIGAGTEYLYILLVQLFGSNKCFGVENPGYKQASNIYKSSFAKVKALNIDEKGLSYSELTKYSDDIDILHLSPSHHFPTGLTMPINRRLELLSWADNHRERYIVEDEYDSEFRLHGRPISTMKSLLPEKVIYINTFSKSLLPNIRIAYMVLPDSLLKNYEKKLGHYSSTVSVFEQYTLAKFISDGYFERHINRMKKKYRDQREKLLEYIDRINICKKGSIIDNNVGTNFIMNIESAYSDEELKLRALKLGLEISFVSDYCYGYKNSKGQLIINYSSLNEEDIKDIFNILKEIK